MASSRVGTSTSASMPFVFEARAAREWDQVRQRLAGACLRGRENVLAFQRLRDRRGLDRSRGHKSGERQPLLDVIGNL